MYQGALLAIFACLVFCGCFKKHPLNENALLHQSACVKSLELKDHARARIHCELCLEYDSSMPECLNGLGLIALQENDRESAKDFFTKALRQDNDFSQARNNLGVIHFSEGDFHRALVFFDRALKIDPSNTDARYNAGLSHLRLAQQAHGHAQDKQSIEHLTTAKDQIKKLLAIEPNFEGAFRDLGLIELNLYDLSEFKDSASTHLSWAKEAFSYCLEGDREDDGCYQGLAQVFLEMGLYEKSFANFFLCLAQAPNNSDCRSGIAYAYEKSTKSGAGYQRFRDIIQDDPNNALAHEAFCYALFEKGLNHDAVRECEIAIRQKPDLCSAHFRLAEYFFSMLNRERSSRHCQAFITCSNGAFHNKIKKCHEILVAAGSP